MFPNAQRMNRGHYEIGQLMEACRANDVTDFILVHEHRGVPDTLIVCHLPFGPTAYFTLSSVVMRHDIPNAGTMSEVLLLGLLGFSLVVLRGHLKDVETATRRLDTRIFIGFE